MKTIRRRRLEAKTDYRARLALLKSGKARLVVRKSNRYIVGQLVTSEAAQDKVLLVVSSKELLAKGWPKDKAGSLKGLAAAYLTGKLFAQKASKLSKEAILDMGMYINASKSRIYAFVKGTIDGGLEVPCSEEVLPTIEDLKRQSKLSEAFDKLNKAI
jgi:large subunit ribosomal protein L18